MKALLVGMTRRNMIEMRRYGFETIVQMAGLALMFLVLFYGARGIGGADVREGDTLTSIVAGYVVFSLVIIAYSSLAAWVTQEALLGTLEQIAMSPYGMTSILVAEFVAGMLIQFVLVGGLLFVAMATTGEWLHLDLLTLAPLVACLLVGVLGIGLAMSGLALVFKRVNSLVMLLQFGFLSLIAAPIEQIPALRYAPISLPSSLIHDSTVEGTGLLDMASNDLVVLVATSAVYLALGVIAFNRLERVARDRGLIGQH